MDKRSKCSAVITFNQDINPQRYILVDLEGLHHMVYRARKVKVNRLDFIHWAISLEKIYFNSFHYVSFYWGNYLSNDLLNIPAKY